MRAVTDRAVFRRPLRRRAPLAPGPRYATFLGFQSEWRRDPLGLLIRLRRRYGRLVAIRMPPVRGYVIADPAAVRHVLQANEQSYWKGRSFGRISRYVGRGMIFNAHEGALLNAQRRHLQPVFRRRNLASMADLMVEAADECLEDWRRRGVTEGAPVDLAWEMSRLTVEIVCSALFSERLGERSEALTGAIAAAVALFAEVAGNALPPALALPRPRYRRYRSALRVGYAFVDEILDRREQSGSPGNDLLGRMLAASADPEERGFDSDQVRDECVMFLGAGSETTAVALAWTWLLLARHSDVETRVRDELARVLGGRTPTFGDLPALPYTRRVVDESLRLYPPVWCQTREPYRADMVGGFRIPSRAICLVSAFLVHRDPELWTHPERFDPDRFLPQRMRRRPRYAYFPFGGGTRRCLGERFALMEIQLVLATLMQRLTIRPVLGAGARLDAGFTLRPRGGLPSIVRLRR